MAKNNKQLSNVQEVRSQNNLELTLQQEQRLYELYKKDNIEDIKFFDAYKSCENVVVFGKPLSGKSTVINSLLGHKLKSIPKPNWDGYFLIDLADPDPESPLKISCKSNPEQKGLTSVSTKDITIWECPGLYKTVGMTKGIEYIDKREEEMKMRESPRVMQLLKTVNSVKFILVAADMDLTVDGGYRGEKFLATVDRIASIFSELELITESILLVITKAPSFGTQERVVRMIEDTIKYRDMSNHTKKLMECLKKSPIHIFYKSEKEGEVEGPTLQLIQNLPSCDVRESIQYPGLSPLNQELALGILQKDDETKIQEEEAKKKWEQAEIDMENISNAWFFTKVVDFLYATLSGMSILSKAGQYTGKIFGTFSSLIGINNFKNYFSLNKTEAVSEKDDSLQPMSPGKIRLAKCLVKMLNDNEALSKEINEKFNECIKQYSDCTQDEERQSIVKQFSEWIISETNLKDELLALEAEPPMSDESYNSSESDSYDGNGGQKPPNQPVSGNQPDFVKIIKIKSNFAEARKNFNAHNPNISEDKVLAEQEVYDKTLDALYEALPNLVKSKGGSGDNLASDDKNPAVEQQEENTTETKTVDEIESDGYDAGVALGGKVNDPLY